MPNQGKTNNSNASDLPLIRPKKEKTIARNQQKTQTQNQCSNVVGIVFKYRRNLVQVL